MADENDYPFKRMLDAAARPYLEELFKTLEAERAFNRGGQSEEFSRDVLPQLLDKASEGHADSTIVLEQLYDLQAVAQAVYTNSEGSVTALKNLIDYVAFFNEKGVINIPLTNGKIRALLTNSNNLSSEDVSEGWHEAIRKEKIDFPNAGLQLLEYLARSTVEAVVSRDEFMLDPNLKEYPKANSFITVKKDHSKVAIFDIKFRRSMKDIRNLILRSIEKWERYPLQFENASKYLIIIVYTHEQDHNFKRLEGQFNKLLIEKDEALLTRIFFLPIALYKTQELQPKLAECFKSLQGHEITFGYRDSPLSHGWSVHESLVLPESVFHFPKDDIYGRALG